jgi:hypothetical protein
VLGASHRLSSHRHTKDVRKICQHSTIDSRTRDGVWERNADLDGTVERLLRSQVWVAGA